MTTIRIDPVEMESACAQLQAQADVVGESLRGLRSQCTVGGLPTGLADQVDATLATLERSLKEIQTELVLEALLLALRGIMAIRASETIAGQLYPVIPRPTGFVSSSNVSAGASFAPTVFASRAAAPSGVTGSGGVVFGSATLGLGDIPTPKNAWTAPEPNDFKSWSQSMKIDTNNNGIPNGMDNNFRGTGPDNYKPKPKDY